MQSYVCAREHKEEEWRSMLTQFFSRSNICSILWRNSFPLGGVSSRSFLTRSSHDVISSFWVSKNEICIPLLHVSSATSIETAVSINILVGAKLSFKNKAKLWFFLRYSQMAEKLRQKQQRTYVLCKTWYLIKWRVLMSEKKLALN